MDKNEELCNRITQALDFFSLKITSQVEDYFYHDDYDCVVIQLKEGSNRSQFCHLLEATGLFTDRDEMRVIFKHTK